LDALKGALQRFRGAFVVVSHNRDFVTGLCSEEWRVSEGRVKVVKVDPEAQAAAAKLAREGPVAGRGGSAGVGAGEDEEEDAEAAILAAQVTGLPRAIGACTELVRFERADARFATFGEY
jgi:hypothetical protein